MVKQHDAGKHLADTDVRVLLTQLVDVVVHCRRDQRGFAIEEVYFDPLAKSPERAASIEAMPAPRRAGLSR
jgi:type IV secretion system protein VirB11